MKSNIIFKELEFDEKAIMDLYLSNKWYAYTNDKESLFNGIKNSLDCIGAYDNDLLVGFIRTIGDKETIIFIQDILVLEQYQRRGIGRSLMKLIISKYSKVRQISLTTHDSEKTRKFYESLGLVCHENNKLIGFTVKK